MDNVFCTLFDSKYLDKGLVLYRSMRACIQEFKLYVFAFDDASYDILKAEGKDDLIPIRLSELEAAYPCLLEAKKDRNAVEYNWTCSAWTIKYVLEQRNEPICTYIDADMRFYSSPDPVFATMREHGCSVIIVPHRFHNDAFEAIEGPKSGYYCVEFNTFVNDANGKAALDWWAGSCCQWCHYIVPSVSQWYGDQKYLNEFPKRFRGVWVCDHYGVGLGPWNDNRMELAGPVGENGTVDLLDKGSSLRYPLVIYHFAGVGFLGRHWLKVPSRMKSKKLHAAVFDPYVNEILDARRYVAETYGLELPRGRSVAAGGFVMRLYQRYVMPIIKIRHLFNLYRVKD